MNVVDLPLKQLREAPWNPNRMDAPMLARLRESVSRFGLVANLVVRPLEGNIHEVVNGNQRLQILRELGFAAAPCVVVDLDDARARLLAQALNRVQGQDDLGLRAELVRDVLAQLRTEDVAALLPDAAASLASLASLGQQDMGEYLANWRQAQQARLKHLSIQLTAAQQQVVEEAFARLLARGHPLDSGNPNPRGNALFHLCQAYLAQEDFQHD